MDKTDITANEETQVQETPKQVVYSLFQNNEWTKPMEGIIDSSGKGRSFAGHLGLGVTNIEISGVSQFRVYTRNRGWSNYVKANIKPARAFTFHNTDPIINIEIVDPDILGSVHVLGGIWLDVCHCSSEPGATSFGRNLQIDGMWLMRK